MSYSFRLVARDPLYAFIYPDPGGKSKDLLSRMPQFMGANIKTEIQWEYPRLQTPRPSQCEAESCPRCTSWRACWRCPGCSRVGFDGREGCAGWSHIPSCSRRTVWWARSCLPATTANGKKHQQYFEGMWMKTLLCEHNSKKKIVFPSSTHLQNLYFFRGV